MKRKGSDRRERDSSLEKGRNRKRRLQEKKDLIEERESAETENFKVTVLVNGELICEGVGFSWRDFFFLLFNFRKEFCRVKGFAYFKWP